MRTLTSKTSIKKLLDSRYYSCQRKKKKVQKLTQPSQNFFFNKLKKTNLSLDLRRIKGKLLSNFKN